MRVFKWVGLVFVAFIVLGVIGNMIGGPGTPTTFTVADVTVVRDSNELRFANDSDIHLLNCTVSIDGGYQSVLRELPARGRSFLMRAQFSTAIPQDEFYVRSLRALTMACFDGGAQPVSVRLK